MFQSLHKAVIFIIDIESASKFWVGLMNKHISEPIDNLDNFL